MTKDLAVKHPLLTFRAEIVCMSSVWVVGRWKGTEDNLKAFLAKVQASCSAGCNLPKAHKQIVSCGSKTLGLWVSEESAHLSMYTTYDMHGF